MITVEHICKTYRVAQRNSGLWAAFSSLFHREYETIHALEDISFYIREGEIVGYIGPSGAGKSSTVKSCPASWFRTAANAESMA